MALWGLKVIKDPEIYKKAKEEFDEYIADNVYICPITYDLSIPD